MIRSPELDRRVLSCLRTAGIPLTAMDIADLVYDDDPSGGPASGHALVAMSITRLRQAGHQIIGRRGRVGGYVYAGYCEPDVTDRVRFRRDNDLEALRGGGRAVLAVVSVHAAEPCSAADIRRLIGRPSTDRSGRAA